MVSNIAKHNTETRTSYMNVYKSLLKAKKSPYEPLWYLLPFLIPVALNVSWLAQPSATNSYILHSSLFLSFIGAWGLQFAHQVGRVILAHVTSTPIPFFDALWLLSVVGALDANLPNLLGMLVKDSLVSEYQILISYIDRAPLVQSSPSGAALMTYFYLIASFSSYARFCYLVINDITEHLGIACFTVRKKDEHGEWKEAQAVNGKKTS